MSCRGHFRADLQELGPFPDCLNAQVLARECLDPCPNSNLVELLAIGRVFGATEEGTHFKHRSISLTSIWKPTRNRCNEKWKWNYWIWLAIASSMTAALKNYITDWLIDQIPLCIGGEGWLKTHPLLNNLEMWTIAIGNNHMKKTAIFISEAG